MIQDVVAYKDCVRIAKVRSRVEDYAALVSCIFHCPRCHERLPLLEEEVRTICPQCFLPMMLRGLWLNCEERVP